MNQDIVDFIRTERIAVFGIEMMDGSPHMATVHVAYVEDVGVFVFETNREYRKSEALFGRPESRASLVIGFDENNPKTFQLDGTSRLLTESEASLKEAYLTKFPNKQKKAEDPTNVFFLFTPTWWRYTDWTKSTGKVIYTSTDQVD